MLDVSQLEGTYGADWVRWFDRAACRGEDPKFWNWPAQRRADIVHAVVVCEGCPVSYWCQRDAESWVAQENTTARRHGVGIRGGAVMTPGRQWRSLAGLLDPKSVDEAVRREAANERVRLLAENPDALSDCGTWRGVREHQRSGEENCAACESLLEANARKNLDNWRAAKGLA